MSHSCVNASKSTAVEPYYNCTYTISDGRGFSFWRVVDGTSDIDPQAGNLAFAATPYVSSSYNESNRVYLDTWLMVDAISATATTCGLWYCLQAYNVSVDNGDQTQVIVGNWSETDVDPTTSRSSFNFTNIPEIMRSGDGYSVAMGGMFEGPLIESGNATFGYHPAWHYYSSDHIRSLIDIEDHDYWIDQFALGMSNNVRSDGITSAPADQYAGQVFTTIPYVHVRWAWLGFPIVMVASSLAFLVACVWQTQRLHVKSYKSDGLELLLARLDIDREIEDLDRKELQGEAVWLDDAGHNPVFRKRNDENA